MTVLVVGDVMLDRYIHGRATRISPEAPTLVVEVDAHDDSLGGAANVAANLAALGVETVLAGAVGNDEAGRRVTKLAQEHGIIPRLVVDPTRPTTVKTRVLAGQQQVLRLDQERSTSLADDVRNDLLTLVGGVACDLIVVQDYDKGVMTSGTIPTLMSRNIPVIVDPKQKNFLSYVGALIFKPNQRELFESLERSGIGRGPVMDSTWLEHARQLTGAQHLLVTLGEKGMVLKTQGVDGLSYLPAQHVPVYDVTGAGDTVLATLAWGLTQGHTIHYAAWAANLAASLQVTKRGTAVITLDELAALIKENDTWPSASSTSRPPTPTQIRAASYKEASSAATDSTSL